MFLAADELGNYDTGGRGPIDDFWYEPLPGKNTAGIRVTDDTAMRIATVYACVTIISQDIAKVPLQLFRRKDDGSRERVTDHPLVPLLRKPTKLFTGVEWRERVQAHQLLRGNAFCEIRTDFRGRIVELYPWDPDKVRVEALDDGTVRYLWMDPQGRERVYLPGEVLHFRGLSLKGPLGMSPIDQAKETLGEAFAAQQYASAFFANDARPSIWLEHPAHFKDEATRKNWLQAFKRAFGSSNRFSPMLTEYGIKIQSIPAVSHADLQFLELRKLKNNEICAIYRVPPHKVAILERSTNNNIEHQGIEYVTDCMLTWCRRTEERLGADLLSDDEREELYFEFQLDALMRGDAASRFTAYQSGINAGWLTRNEVRRRENLDSLEGLDEPLQPVNMLPAGSVPAGTVAEPDDTPPPDDAGEPEEDAQEAEARGRALELQARRRVLNREVRALSREWERSAGSAAAFKDGVATFYAGHAAFVREALALSEDRATEYLMRQCAAIEGAVANGKIPALLKRWELAAAKLEFPPLPAAQPRKGKP